MSREDILVLLRKEEGFLSGQELSRRLGLSRAAVWKTVDALRREGYEIEARTGLGYRLAAAPDAMTVPEIRSFLGETAAVGRELRCFAELDSTNNYAKTLAQTGAPDGTAVIADSQTAGRGRMERSFQSPKGQGIYLSVLLRPALPPDQLPPVTALAGVVGAGGLGDLAIRYGHQRNVPSVMWVTVLILIVIVQVVQSVFSRLSVRIDKRLK